VDSFKNYLLNKSGRYRYYKSEYIRLKQESDDINEKRNQYRYYKSEYIRLKQESDDINEKRNQMLYLETILEDIHDVSVLNKKFCPICNSEFLAFLPFGENPRKNAMCPVCHSLERHRLSYLFLKEKPNIFEENIKMLHFAPEEIFHNIFSNNENIDYLPVDINPDMPYVKEMMDIQDIKYPDNTFDFIYCSHVLEHVPNDQKAIKELYRVLKPGGSALIMVPINLSLKETYEDESVNTPELRLKHYGASDHLRYYGLDFQGMLENAGFKIKKYSKVDFDKESIKKYGLSWGDVFCAAK